MSFDLSAQFTATSKRITDAIGDISNHLIDILAVGAERELEDRALSTLYTSYGNGMGRNVGEMLIRGTGFFFQTATLPPAVKKG